VKNAGAAKNKLQSSKRDIPVAFVSCEIEKARLSGPGIQIKEISKHFLF